MAAPLLHEFLVRLRVEGRLLSTFAGATGKHLARRGTQAHLSAHQVQPTFTGAMIWFHVCFRSPVPERPGSLQRERPWCQWSL